MYMTVHTLHNVLTRDTEYSVRHSNVIYYHVHVSTPVNALPESVYVVLNTFPRYNKYYNTQTHNSMTVITRLLFFKSLSIYMLRIRLTSSVYVVT